MLVLCVSKSSFLEWQPPVNGSRPQLPHGWIQNPLWSTVKLSLLGPFAVSHLIIAPPRSQVHLQLSLCGQITPTFPSPTSCHVSFHPSIPGVSIQQSDGLGRTCLSLSAQVNGWKRAHTNTHTDFSGPCHPFTWLNGSILRLLIGCTERQVTHLFLPPLSLKHNNVTSTSFFKKMNMCSECFLASSS